MSNNTSIKLRTKLLPHYKGELPKYESLLSSGFDVRAQLDGSNIALDPRQRILVPTGLSFEIPPGYELQVRPRSGLAIKSGITTLNSPGTIDADYRGEVKVILINHSQDTVKICDQHRIAQVVLCPVVQAEFEVVEELSSSKRGAGGFGSTGL